MDKIKRRRKSNKYFSNLSAIAKIAIQYISDAVKFLEPDTITDHEKENVRNAAVTVYAVAKTYGRIGVESTATDLDDDVLNEVIQVGEEAAAKYGFSLDATQV